MRSHKKLELNKETLRCLTSDVPSQQLLDVRGGANASFNTCLECVTTVVAPTLVECVTRTTTVVAPTLIDTDCWATR